MQVLAATASHFWVFLILHLLCFALVARNNSAKRYCGFQWFAYESHLDIALATTTPILMEVLWHEMHNEMVTYPNDIALYLSEILKPDSCLALFYCTLWDWCMCRQTQNAVGVSCLWVSKIGRFTSAGQIQSQMTPRYFWIVVAPVVMVVTNYKNQFWPCLHKTIIYKTKIYWNRGGVPLVLLVVQLVFLVYSPSSSLPDYQLCVTSPHIFTRVQFVCKGVSY